MDWAEKAYPQLFPGHKASLTSTPYVYRFYPETGNYVGVAGSQAYVLGPFSNGAVLAVGALSDFTCQVTPRDCVVPSVQRIAATLYTSAFVLPDGRVGLLGKEEVPVRYSGLVPGSVVALVDGITNAVSVRAWDFVGYHKIVYLTAEGDVYGWGNGRKSLGQASGGNDQVTAPVKVTQLSNVVDISLADGNMTVALKTDGTVWVLPGLELDNGQLGAVRIDNLPRIKAISPSTGSSYQPTVAVDESGQVWTIKRSTSVRDAANRRTLYPVTVERMLFAPSGVQQIACQHATSPSGSTCMAVVEDGTMKAWGQNNGRLGDGSTIDSSLPVTVRMPATERVRQLSLDGNCSLALTESGRLYYWGCDYVTGEFVTAHDRPLSPTVLYSGIGEYAVFDSRRIVAVSTTGQVYSWGRSNSESLGDGRTSDSDTPVRVIGLTLD